MIDTEDELRLALLMSKAVAVPFAPTFSLSPFSDAFLIKGMYFSFDPRSMWTMAPFVRVEGAKVGLVIIEAL